jgi:hypothetical protein
MDDTKNELHNGDNVTAEAAKHSATSSVESSASSGVSCCKQCGRDTRRRIQICNLCMLTRSVKRAIPDSEYWGRPGLNLPDIDLEPDALADIDTDTSDYRYHGDNYAG